MTLPPDRSDPISAGQPIAPGATGGTGPNPNAAGFQSQMQSAQRTAPQQGPSPAQVPQGPGQPGAPSIDSLTAQVSTSQDSLATVRNQLNNPNLTLKRSQQHLLRNKLSDASTYLRAANGRLGGEIPPMPQAAGPRPIERFLNYIGDGENQLNSVKKKLADLSKTNGQIRPADFLLIQIKMNQAQQEIEYSSTLLGKIITSITQILNTQI